MPTKKRESRNKPGMITAEQADRIINLLVENNRLQRIRLQKENNPLRTLAMGAMIAGLGKLPNKQ